jgi:hypothetical protein
MSAGEPNGSESFPELDEGGRGCRRAHPRVPRPPLSVSGLWGRVQDISMTGICLHLDAPVRHGECYDLILTDEISGDYRWIQAEVIWCTADRAGLSWVDLSEDEEQWLVTRFQRWLGELRTELHALEVRLETADR